MNSLIRKANQTVLNPSTLKNTSVNLKKKDEINNSLMGKSAFGAKN